MEAEGGIARVPYKKPRSSAVWHYFSDNGNESASCNWCSRTISYKGGSMCNLRRHLILQHPTHPNLPVWPGRSKKYRKKMSSAAIAAVQEKPPTTNFPEIIVMENNDGKSAEVSGTSTWRETENPSEKNEDGGNTSLTGCTEDSHHYSWSGSLTNLEAELLKMAQTEHKTKMEILSLKKRYLELKISLVEKNKVSKEVGSDSSD